MNVALEILRKFRRMGVAPVVRQNVGYGRWCGCSQYGYTIFVRAERKDALRDVLKYYSDRMHLIRQ
jgi:hypothetical protein